MKNNENNSSGYGVYDDEEVDPGAKSRFISSNWNSSLKRGEVLSVLFVGVGGQGIILATTVVAHAVINAGLDVKVSEVHGMAQRGGSVVGSVRAGRKVFSPTINKADFIVALEKLEGLRYLNMLAGGGYAFVNNVEIYPSSVFSKGNTYPSNIEDRVKRVTNNYLFMDAIAIAHGLKELRASNIILIGALSRFLPFKYDCWEDAIKECVPQKAVKINIEAFNCGRNYF